MNTAIPSPPAITPFTLATITLPSATHAPLWALPCPDFLAEKRTSSAFSPASLEFGLTEFGLTVAVSASFG
jgi:hypothetical protein